MPTYADFLGFFPIYSISTYSCQMGNAPYNRRSCHLYDKNSTSQTSVTVVGDYSVLFQNFLVISVMSTYIGNSYKDT